MNHRRKLLIALGSGALVNPLTTRAQAPAKPRRIGYLGLASAEADAAGLAAFREGMAALGWIDGRGYVIEARYANGIAQAGPGAAAELIATRPDLLLGPGDGAALLLAKATQTIPIVFATAQDPREQRHRCEPAASWRQRHRPVNPGARSFREAPATIQGGELPIQQPVTFEMVVNFKTAKAIGVTLPPIVLLQANRVIE